MSLKTYKKTIKYFGYLITFLSFYYIYQTLVELNINLANSIELISSLNYLYLVISGIFYLMVLSIGAMVWIYIIKFISNENITNKYELADVYAKSNIGKYIPGNFMQFVGRNVLGHRLGYKHSVLALSTIVELLLSVFTGFIMIVVLYFYINPEIPTYLINYISKFSPTYLLIIPIIVVPVIYVLFKFIVFDRLMNNHSLKACVKAMFVIVIYYIVTYIFMGFINIFVFESMHSSWSLLVTDYMNLLFIFIISWIAGLIVPGAPGGIGVREAIFIFISSHNYDIRIVISASILIRLVNIVGDIFFVLISINYKKFKCL